MYDGQVKLAWTNSCPKSECYQSISKLCHTFIHTHAIIPTILVLAYCTTLGGLILSLTTGLFRGTFKRNLLQVYV